MIDKFDARIHLDQIDPVAEDAREDRDETWKKCCFEAYRDLVPLMVKGVKAEDRLSELEDQEKDLHSIHKSKKGTVAEVKFEHEDVSCFSYLAGWWV
eukprot:m.45208 g.45208  ORF g.45208 m.45208 type:complete len:97 (-) comp13078_c0_seq3:602-892(-)